MADCRHLSAIIGFPFRKCLDCGSPVPMEPCRFERREVSHEELVALFGEELAKLLTDPRPASGRLTVASIGPGPTITFDPEDS